MSDHAGLAEHERHEDPDDVKLDQLGHLGVERHDQHDRESCQQDDAVAESESIPT